MAFLAVVTLIKDCYKIKKSHNKQTIFSHFMGPTVFLNTKVLQGIQTFLLCIPTDIELSYRLLLSLHSIIAVSVYPSFPYKFLVRAYSERIVRTWVIWNHYGCVIRKVSKHVHALNKISVDVLHSGVILKQRIVSKVSIRPSAVL